MLWTLLVAYLVSISATVDIPVTTTLNTTGNVTEHAVKHTRKHLANITRHFVHYYSYFGHQPGSFGGMGCYQCPVPKYHNETESLIANALTSTVTRGFTPRILSRNQVSWRAKDEKSKPKPSTTVGNATIPGDGNNGTSTIANVDVDEEPPARNDTIHKHLVFALLLPHHPFSQDVRRILTTVAPMYPQMTVVLGNAYDFKDMSSKYFVTSFPKILYFKAGIYVENYVGEYDAVELAAQMTEWANALPSAIPIPFRDTKLAATTPKEVRDFDIYAPGAQMRHGLSLQPLPRTAQYPLVDMMLPQWALDAVPYLRQWNNSAFIERRAARSSPAPAAASAAASVAVPAAGTAATDASSSTSTGTSALRAEHSLSPADGAQSAEGAVSGAQRAGACADGSTVDGTGTCPAQPQSTEGTTAGEDLHREHSDEHGVHSEPTPQAVDHAADTAAPSTGTETTTSAASPASVPLVVTITVPFPNMEPFLGSIENYAVWDTRVFLLAGVYTIARFLYLVWKYVFGKGAEAAPVGGGNH